MQKTVNSLAALLLVVVVPTLVAAQDNKPVMVASISSYDDVVKHAATIGQLAGVPQVAEMIDGQIMAATQGKGLAGMDKSKPIIVIATADEKVAVYIPVTDFDQMAAVLPGGATPTADPNIFETAGMEPQFTVLHKLPGWAVLQADAEQAVADDPLPVAASLTTAYPIAIKIMVQNFPPDQRKEFVGNLQMFANQGLVQSGVAGDVSLDRQMQRLNRLVNEFDELTIGIGLEEASQTLFLEVIATAVDGSQTATEFSRLKETTSSHSGLLAADAAITAFVTYNAKKAADEVAILDAQHKQSVADAVARIDGDAGVPADVKATAKEAVSKVIDVAFETLKGEVFDAGLALFVNDKSTLVAGGYISDGPGLEEAIKKIASLEASLPPINWDAENYQGYNLHLLTVPVPVPPAQAFFGPQIEVALAFAANSCYLSVGGDGVAKLKSIIDASAAGKGTTVKPFQIKVALAPVASAASAADPTGMANQMAQLLKENGQVLITSSAITNGTQTRIEIQQNFIKAIGTAVPMMMQMLGGAGGGGFGPPDDGGDPFGGEGGDDPFGGGGDDAADGADRFGGDDAGNDPFGN